MKNAFFIFGFLFLLMSCQPSAQPGGDELADDEIPLYQKLITSFREEYKDQAESFENSNAVFTINPCKDSIDPLITNATSGRFQVNGTHVLDYTNMTRSPLFSSECMMQTYIPDNETAGKSAKLTNPNNSVLVSSDYTVIVVSKAFALNILTNRGSRISVIQGDGAFGASATVMESSDNQPFYSRTEFKDMAGAPNSLTVASFEFNRSNNQIAVEGFNTKLGEFHGAESLNPNLTGSDSPYVGDFSIKEIEIFLSKGQTEGLLYMGVFPKMLSAEEKKLLLCYGMFASALNGDHDLLLSYYGYCGVTVQ